MTALPIVERMAAVRSEIDRVLDAMPDNRLDARRHITRELGLDPTAAELQAIEKVAHDELARGPARDFCRSALTLRLLVDREMRDLYETPSLNVEQLSNVEQLIPGIVDALSSFRREMAAHANAPDDAPGLAGEQPLESPRSFRRAGRSLEAVGRASKETGAQLLKPRRRRRGE